MIHPMWGDLIECLMADGQQHDQSHVLAVDECEACVEAILICETCQVVISCCYCGKYHAYECPWPL